MEVAYIKELLNSIVHPYRIRKSYQKVQEAIRKLWEQYDENLITTSELLKQCGKVYSPSFQVEDNNVNQGWRNQLSELSESYISCPGQVTFFNWLVRGQVKKSNF